MAFVCLFLMFSCEKETEMTAPRIEGPELHSSSHLSYLTFSKYRDSEVDVPDFFSGLGLSINKEKGVFLPDRERKSEHSLIEAYPVVGENQSLVGFLWKGHSSNESKYITYHQFVEAMEKFAPACEGELNILASMFFSIELYGFSSLPHESISTFLQEVSMLDCELDKDLKERVVGQYIERDESNYPTGIVAYEYEVILSCTSGGVGGPSDPVDPFSNVYDSGGGGSNGNGNSNNNNNEEANAAKAKKLRDFLVEEYGYSFDDFGRLNVAAGAAFEQAVLATYGFTQNTQLFDSPVRASITQGAHTKVQPDATSYAVYTPEVSDVITGEDEIVIIDDATFIEVKAYSSTVNLSTSDYQILGEIDAVAEEFYSRPASERGNAVPSFFLFTLGEVSDGITSYCTDRNVQFFHGRIDIDDDNSVQVSSIDQKNAVAGPLNISYLGRRAELDCPPGSLGSGNRLDPEVLSTP